ncbi:hypothetical protein GCM10022631_10860 [Deinococcus rubellus]|uniref:hypothetical protein n=1 Tax=Deinococcus rubellus TaxID=1889240 RepID=UPI0031EA0B19
MTNALNIKEVLDQRGQIALLACGDGLGVKQIQLFNFGPTHALLMGLWVEWNDGFDQKVVDLQRRATLAPGVSVLLDGPSDLLALAVEKRLADFFEKGHGDHVFTAQVLTMESPEVQHLRFVLTPYGELREQNSFFAQRVR